MNLLQRLSGQTDLNKQYSWYDLWQDIKLRWLLIRSTMTGMDEDCWGIDFIYNEDNCEKFHIHRAKKFKIWSKRGSSFFLLYGHIGTTSDSIHRATFMLCEKPANGEMVIHFCPSDVSGKIPQLHEMVIHENNSTIFSIDVSTDYGKLTLTCRQKYIGIPKDKVLRCKINMSFDSVNFKVESVENELTHW